jgi:replicative DNA helicase
LPDLAEKEDVVDWVRHGGTREAFIDFIKNSPVWNKEANIFDSKASIASIFTDSLLYWNGIRKGEIKFIPACTIFSSHVNAYVKKHINVVSGYTSAGKSTLLAQVLVELGRLGAEVDVFSLEDSREEKFMTMIAVMTGVHKRKMILGTFSDDEKKKITEAAAEAINWKIRIYDTIRTIPDMEKIIRSSLASVICLDYVQNLFIDRNSIYEKMSFAAQEIFRLATQYNQTWNVLSQVSNDSVRNESDLMGLKGAGELSAIANSVMELKKGRKEENIHKVTLKVRKNKTWGPTGDIELAYNDSWTKLENVSNYAGDNGRYGND